MLGIRLQRTGRKNAAAYRIVVAERSSPIKGRFVEILGYYLPRRNPVVFECNAERIAHWVGNGARPTDTVARLLKKNGIDGMDKFVETYTKKKKRNPSEEEVVEEAPVGGSEEVKEEAKQESGDAEDAKDAKEEVTEESKEDPKPESESES